MSKALEAAHEAGAKAYYDVQFGDEAKSTGCALEAYRDAFLAHLAEDAQGPLSGPEIMMREAIWVELGAALFDVPVEQLNRAVRASYRAALRTLAGKE